MNKSGSPRRRIVAAIVVILVVAIAAYTTLVLVQRSKLYYPNTATPTLVNGAEDVSFTTSDGLTLHTWLFAPTGESRDVAVLLCPGNRDNRAVLAGLANEIATLGYTALLLEYRGYGGNPGTPSEKGLARDAQAAVGFLHERGFPSNRIIYAGESLGTGVVARLATVDQPAAVLLRSPYTNMSDMVKTMYPTVPLHLLVLDRYDTMRYLPKITVPITVLAGDADELIPLSQATAVANKAPNLFKFDVVEGAGHDNSIWRSAYVAAQIDALAKEAIK